MRLPDADDKLRDIRWITDAALSHMGADGLTRLCQAVTPGPPERVCASVMQALVGGQYPGDDIALLVLRWLPEETPALARPAQG